MNSKAPRMTKKHFEFLADAIYEAYGKDTRPKAVNDRIVCGEAERIAVVLAYYLQQTNEHFDRAKFIDRAVDGKE